MDTRSRLVALAGLVLPALAWAGPFESGQKVGQVVGVILSLGLLVWVLFIARWSEVEGQGGFFFRLGVVLLPYFFAWGTLRSGFKLAARVLAFGWMILVLAGAFTGAGRGRGGAAELALFQEGMVRGCMKNGRLSQEICECLARAYVESHTLAETEELQKALKRNQPPDSYREWVLTTVERCRAGGVAVAAPAAGDPAAPAPTAAPGARADEPPPDIARTTCTVTTEPPGAEILLEGKPTGLVTPAGVTIWAGRENHLEVRLKGFASERFSRFPNLNQDTQQHFTLRPAVEVTFRSTPAAEVLLDGEAVGSTPGTAWVPLGRHSLVFRANGYADVEERVEAVAAPIELDVTLLPAVTLQVRSSPRGATFWIDGRRVREPAPTRLAAGAEVRHFFVGVLSGFMPATHRSEPLPAGDRDDVMLTLEPARSGDRKACAARARGRVKALEKTKATLEKALASGRSRDRDADQARLQDALRELASRRVEVQLCAGTLPD